MYFSRCQDSHVFLRHVLVNHSTSISKFLTAHLKPCWLSIICSHAIKFLWVLNSKQKHLKPSEANTYYFKETA